MTNLNDFIEQLLGLPWDTRRDLFKIAEKNYEGETYTIEQVYGYIYWRYCLPMNNCMSWHYLFDNSVAENYEGL